MPLRSTKSDGNRDILTIDWGLTASPEAVWAHLTSARRLREWLGRPLALDDVVGGEIRVDHGDGYVCRSVVNRFEPASYRFDVSWQFPDEHETRIEVLLSPSPDELGSDSSLLTLAHMDLAALRDSYARGWFTHLTFFEASLDRTPLPFEQFWNLHATFVKLNGAS